MTDVPIDPTKEFEAMKTIHTTLSSLSPEVQGRVLSYVANVLNLADRVTFAAAKNLQKPLGSERTAAEVGTGANRVVQDQSGDYSTFAEFSNAASPSNGVERVLVAGYWLQVIGKEDGFASQDANRELKHLGHQSTNITRDLDNLQTGSPKLVIQVKKSGNTKQARKLYKLTHAGIKQVEGMLGG